MLVQYGDDHIKEVEALWSALCVWPQNIRVTLNYLSRMTCVSGNLPLMLQQAKRIVLCLSRSQARPIVTELIKDLQASTDNVRFQSSNEVTETVVTWVCFFLLLVGGADIRRHSSHRLPSLLSCDDRTRDNASHTPPRPHSA